MTVEPCWPHSVRCAEITGSWLIAASTWAGPYTLRLDGNSKLTARP